MDWLLDIAAGPGAGGVLAGRHPARSRGRPAVLRHHLHLLRDRPPRHPGHPRHPRPARPRTAARHHPGRHHRGRGHHPGRHHPGRHHPGRHRAGSRGHGRRGGVPDLRQVEGLPRRPAPGRDRHGRHEGRDPGAGVVLAGQHHRLGADPPSPRGHAGLDPGAGHVGRRPRVLLGGEPARAAPRRRALHHRREAALRLRGGHRRAVPARPLPARPRQPAGQGSQDRHR